MDNLRNLFIQVKEQNSNMSRDNKICDEKGETAYTKFLTRKK